MHKGLNGSVAVLGLLFGFTTAAFAQEQTKSWEVDVYDRDVDVTYVDDGYDDVHVYDHNNHNNDRSYIAQEPNYRYRDSGYRDSGYRDGGYRDGGYGYYDDRRAHVPRHYRPNRYRVQYHHDYGRRGYGHGYRGW